RTLDGVLAWTKVSLTVRGGSGSGEAVYGNLVSGNLFAALGVRPALGRFFLPEEDQTELTHPVIVVSDAFWRAHLGGDSSAVGRDVLVNGQHFTLIGIAPADFQGMDAPIRTDAWVPLHMQRALRSAGSTLDPSATWLRIGARLRNGVRRDAAYAELSTLTTADAATEPPELRPYSAIRISPLTGLPPDATSTLTGFLALLLGAATLVLLIASVNVAALLSARSVSRRREMAVRIALGATRRRLIGQLLTEILVLFGLGALGGILVALAATAALERLPIPTEVPIRLVLSPDPRVFAFAMIVSLLAGLAVGLAPTRQAVRTGVSARMRDGSDGSTASRSLIGSALVVVQLAVSLVLLVGAGLFVRALQRAGRVDPGFETAGVSALPLDVEAWGYDEARGRAFYRALEERVAEIPGVTSAAYTTIVPLNLHRSGDDIGVEGNAATDANGRLPIEQILVGSGYFSVLRLPLVAGRVIGVTDDERSAKVAVVNATLAKRLSPDGSALGRTFDYHGARVTIVGIVRDAKYASLDEATPALAYFPLAQYWLAKRSLLIRSAPGIGSVAPALEAAISATDPNAPRTTVTPLEASMAVALLPQRVAALVTGILGAVGLLLSMSGLYGVIAFSAARRTREIGIRLALGARSGDVLRMILGDGARLISIGVTLGLMLAAGATRLLESLLYGVSSLDLPTYIAMPAALIAVALLASYLPARRAAAAEPASVLRSEG
ncbi:MAG: ADOP family duplicated permease, partial [Gemmatimonadota bacterium]